MRKFVSGEASGSWFKSAQVINDVRLMMAIISLPSERASDGTYRVIRQVMGELLLTLNYELRCT